jgi:TM2 domain-containing membrane protein YozV
MGPGPVDPYGGPPQQWGAPPVPQAGPNRVTVGILAILLGSLGVHKFMLGHTVPGIILLVVSLVTCGMVPAVIGLVEGIMYLTKSDAEFYQTYVVGRKAWF